jgi:hypothetical protein
MTEMDDLAFTVDVYRLAHEWRAVRVGVDGEVGVGQTPCEAIRKLAEQIDRNEVKSVRRVLSKEIDGDCPNCGSDRTTTALVTANDDTRRGWFCPECLARG